MFHANAVNLFVFASGDLEDFCVVEHALEVELDLPLSKELVISPPVNGEEELVGLFDEDPIFTCLLSVPTCSTSGALDRWSDDLMIMLFHLKY